MNYLSVFTKIESRSGHILFAGATMTMLLLSSAVSAIEIYKQVIEKTKYFTLNEVMLEDGSILENMIIGGPPTPPPGYDLERRSVLLPDADTVKGIKTLQVPAFNWVLGCSAVSGGMIAAFHDRNGYPKIYTGPTNGGVMPMDNSSWPTWKDGSGATYPNCPLIASKNSVDGRTTKGSIDDYWIKYVSSSSDPYITNGWTEHAWESAIGDYMKTSQSVYENTDGATSFYNYNSSTKLQCTAMADIGIKDDGNQGRKAFYEAKGYTVKECYNQQTDNQVTGGFSFANYKAEIDSGNPVLLHLYGHSIVGFGYDEATQTVYLHDTWDYNAHQMTWGSSYSGMDLHSVSVLRLAPNNDGGSPDFRLTSMVLTPTSPIANTTFSAKITVKNEGTNAGLPGLLQVWTNQGTQPACQALGNASTRLTNSLNPGDSVSVTLTGLKAGTAGSRTFRAFVDSECKTNESLENNNQATQTYTVKPTLPDFVVTGITLTPISPAANSRFSVTVTVKNQGAVASNGGYLDVWPSSSTVPTCGAEGNAWASVGTLAAGASKDFTFTMDSGRPRSKTFRAFVDSWCETDETNNANNQKTKAYSVQP